MITKNKINKIKKIIIDILNPEEIILFGSYANQTQNENSDLDLLIMVDKSDEPRFKRAREIRKYLWGITNVPKDILIYTDDEVKYWGKIPYSFINNILQNGVKIYERRI